MPYIKSTDGEKEINLFYEDLGTGKNVVFIHGWPLSHDMWEYQINELAGKGYRCVAYDRRGFGKSDKPWSGYDYDSLAADLKAVIDTLELTDVTLVGFSMGGGEVARYFANYGSDKISKAVLISAVTPYLLKDDTNPDGVPEDLYITIQEKLWEDRPAFLADFGNTFFGVGLLSKPVSDEFLQYCLGLELAASPKGTRDCVTSFSHTDFRQDMAAISVPTLIIHGDADKTVPINISGDVSSKLVANNHYIVYEGAPHGLFYTDKEKLNRDLMAFI